MTPQRILEKHNFQSSRYGLETEYKYVSIRVKTGLTNDVERFESYVRSCRQLADHIARLASTSKVYAVFWSSQRVITIEAHFRDDPTKSAFMIKTPRDFVSMTTSSHSIDMFLNELDEKLRSSRGFNS